MIEGQRERKVNKDKELHSKFSNVQNITENLWNLKILLKNLVIFKILRKNFVIKEFYY